MRERDAHAPPREALRLAEQAQLRVGHAQGVRHAVELHRLRVDAKALHFDGVADAMRVPQSELRLFGKPESFVKRRMGVALAHDDDVERARTLAKEAASKVKPRAA